MTADESDVADAGPAEKLSNPTPITGEHPGGPRADEPPFPAVAEATAEHLAGDPTGHDMHHVWRVFRLAMRIADAEGSDRVARATRGKRDEGAAQAADRGARSSGERGDDAARDRPVDHQVVGAAALTHDLHRVRGDGTGVAPESTLEDVADILRSAGFPDEKIDAVQHCVAVHDEYAFRGDDPSPKIPEAEIVRDADNLDAMGAIGVARTFVFGGAHEMPLWDPAGETYSQLYHFEDKLLKLREEMHTDAARAIAADRHDFLESFHDRFRAEWHGEL